MSPADRLREEDPFTGHWTRMASTRIVGERSRFEVDFNRPREKAVYQIPADAWGLAVWKDPLPKDVIAQSLRIYDRFYDALYDLLTGLVRRHGRVVVLDLHSYNHRRGGPEAPPEDAAANPDINIGTGTMERDRWAGVVDRVIADLRRCQVAHRPLDVRENVRFFGGQVPRWIHQTFPESACALAVEVKKFFMDEWTGNLDAGKFAAVGRALASTRPGILEELKQLDIYHDQRRTQVRRAGRRRRRTTGAQ